MIAAIDKLVVDNVFEIMGEVIATVGDADRVEGNVSIVKFEGISQFGLGASGIGADTLDNVGLFKIAEILDNGVDGAGDMLVLEVGLDRTGGEDAGVGLKNIINDAAEKFGVLNVVADNEVVLDDGSIKVEKIGIPGFWGGEFKTLGEAAPDEIV